MERVSSTTSHRNPLYTHVCACMHTRTHNVHTIGFCICNCIAPISQNLNNQATLILPSLTIAPLKVKMAVSPLVSRQTPIQVRKPPQIPLATTTTAVANNNPGAENTEDVSSPAAAKARTAAVNSSFVANIKTPVSLFQRTPQIPLQKAVLLSAGECM